MKIVIIQIACKSAYRPDNYGEGIEFDCLFEEINVGISAICVYYPGHNQWRLQFKEQPELYAIEKPDLDIDSFSCGGFAPQGDYLKNPDLAYWWGAYAIASCRKKLEVILGFVQTTANHTEFAERAVEWIKAHGLDVWDDLPQKQWIGIKSTEYYPSGELYEVKATRPIDHPSQMTHITVGIYEASSPQDAIDRSFRDDPRKHSKYRNWEATLIAIDQVHTLYTNLDGTPVLKHS